MKELYILDSSFNSTAAANNRLLAFGLALQKKGVKVTYFYLFPDRNQEKCSQYLDKLNFVYLWEDSPFKSKYLNTIRSIRKFYKLMRPEIPVYAYSLLNCIYFLRMKKGIRLYHEYTENPEVIGKIGGLLGKFLYNLYKKTIPQLDGLFLITPALRKKYIDEFGAAPDRTVLLNMVVDIHRFDDIDAKPNSNTITYCGIISEFKDGVSFLIKAFAITNKKHPEYKLQLIGPFRDDNVKKNIKQLVKILHIEDKVTFTGPIPPEEMPIKLKQSKILALARPDNKQARYGFATKIGEYLMSERPVVLTRVGEVQNCLVDKESCVFAKPDSVEDFADKLLWTIDNYETATKIGKNGRLTALNNFDSEKESEKIYNHIFKK